MILTFQRVAKRFGVQNRKRMPPLVGVRLIFYRSKSLGASVFDILKHPRASVSQNVGVEGHPFSQNGHPFFKTPFLEGISCNQLLFSKLKKAIQQHTRFAPHTEARLAKRSRSHFRILQSPLPWLWATHTYTHRARIRTRTRTRTHARTCAHTHTHSRATCC